MKYLLFILMTFSTFCHAGKLEECYAITGGSAWIASCFHTLSEDTKIQYEKAYVKFLKQEKNKPEHLNNPEEFLATIQAAKQTWETAIALECKAEGLIWFKDTYADRSDRYICLYHAYKNKIAYYEKFHQPIKLEDNKRKQSQ
jgi:hypothetical protein